MLKRLLSSVILVILLITLLTNCIGPQEQSPKPVDESLVPAETQSPTTVTESTKTIEPSKLPAKVSDVLPQIESWGFCRNFDAQQNPVDNSLLFSSEDVVTFWADVNVNSLENAPSVEFEWINPRGQSQQTSKKNPTSTNIRILDVLSMKELGDNKVGTWHVRLIVNGESIFTQFFLIVSPKELESGPISVGQAKAPHFIVGDEPFRFLGAWVSGAGFDQVSADRVVRTAKMSGFSVLALMLPYSQTFGDESSLRQLDIFLDRAGAYGIYVIVTIIHGYGMSLDKTSPWYTPRGIEGLIHDQNLRVAYKDLLKRVVTRKNTINGLMYYNDPTIMAWDLITEPIIPTSKVDPPNVTGEQFKQWLQEMRGYVRNLDPNHLVTVQLTESIGFIQDWPQSIMPELDFFYADTNLYELLFVKNQPLTEDFLDQRFGYPVYSIGKPVMPILSYTSNKLDEKFANDYGLQGQIYMDALQKGFQIGMDGAGVFCWGTRKPQKDKQSFEHLLTYDVANEQIVIPLLKMAASLSTLDWPKPPLQFVRVAP